jgi:hypothetical protein
LRREWHTKAAVIPRVFAAGARSVEVDLTNATNVVFGEVPSPGRHGVPLLDLDLHCGSVWAIKDAIATLERRNQNQNNMKTGLKPGFLVAWRGSWSAGLA